MLLQLAIKDVLLIKHLDIALPEGFTVLTGETGAGKSIILDSLGFVLGGKPVKNLLRKGTDQAVVCATFTLAKTHAAFDLLQEKGIELERDEDLILRRQLSSDGRSRAFANDQVISLTLLKTMGDLLVEIHGRHETSGLLDPKSHGQFLDQFGNHAKEKETCALAWQAWKKARESLSALEDRANTAAARGELLSLRLSELDRLDPKPGEEEDLASTRTILGSAEKALSDLEKVRGLNGDAMVRQLSQALHLLDQARARLVKSGLEEDHILLKSFATTYDAFDRTLIEAKEAMANLDDLAERFECDPQKLEWSEERLFALRDLAKKLGVTPEDLPKIRIQLARELQDIEDIEADLEKARMQVKLLETAYREAALVLRASRKTAGELLTRTVLDELPSLKLEKARFRVLIAPAEDRPGPEGMDQITFEVATHPGADFGPIQTIASSGELARFALALKAALAQKGIDDKGEHPVMIFDEVDQGVGGAVADAVGIRLKTLAKDGGQVLVVTHSPQVAAYAGHHFRVTKSFDGEEGFTHVILLDPAKREEEIARMLSGSEVTKAARAAAQALISG